MTDQKPCRHDLLNCFECDPDTIDDPLPPAPEPLECPCGEGIFCDCRVIENSKPANLTAVHPRCVACEREIAALKAEVERLDAEVLKRDEEAGYQEVVEMQLKAEVERLTNTGALRTQSLVDADNRIADLEAEVERLNDLIEKAADRDADFWLADLASEGRDIKARRKEKP